MIWNHWSKFDLFQNSFVSFPGEKAFQQCSPDRASARPSKRDEKLVFVAKYWQVYKWFKSNSFVIHTRLEGPISYSVRRAERNLDYGCFRWVRMFKEERSSMNFVGRTPSKTFGDFSSKRQLVFLTDCYLDCYFVLLICFLRPTECILLLILLKWLKCSS